MAGRILDLDMDLILSPEWDNLPIQEQIFKNDAPRIMHLKDPYKTVFTCVKCGYESSGNTPSCWVVGESNWENAKKYGEHFYRCDDPHCVIIRVHDD